MTADTFTHGESGYQRRCRCATCRHAQSTRVARQTARRSRALRLGNATPPHGVRSTYKNYSCRCEACRAAQSAYMAAWKQRQKASA